MLERLTTARSSGARAQRKRVDSGTPAALDPDECYLFVVAIGFVVKARLERTQHG